MSWDEKAVRAVFVVVICYLSLSLDARTHDHFAPVLIGEIFFVSTINYGRVERKGPEKDV